MKVYYKEDDIYPAKYNFKDEVDGTVDTDIIFFTVKGGDDSNRSATIVASEDGHKKVVKFVSDGDNGTIATWTFNPDNQISGTKEYYFKYKDNGQGYHELRLYNESGTYVMQVRFNAIDNKFYVYHAAINTSVSAAADIWHHIKITFDCAMDTHSVWLNGVSVVSGVDFVLSRIATTINYGIYHYSAFAGANAMESYLDAVGYSWDSNYNVGDNRTTDYHYYNRELLTNIIRYPTIIPHNNMHCLCSVVLRDFEGALFSTWHSKDSTEFVIEDNDENKLFRGYLINKKFAYNQLELFLAGLGVKLDWMPFYKDYVLQEGKVKIVPATSTLTMYDDKNESGVWDAGEDFNWLPDKWIFDQYVGLLLIDSTKTIDVKTWECSAISQTNGTLEDGGVNPLDEPNDDDVYYVTETSVNWNAFITPVMTAAGGDEVATTKILNKIRINYCFHHKETTPLLISVRYTLKIRDSDGDWEEIATKKITGGQGFWKIVEGYHDIVMASSDLAKFLTTDNGNWDETLELKLEFIYSGDNQLKGYIKLDYLTVEVHYEAYAIQPIMAAITDSAVSTLTCSSIAKWDETGLSVNDDFKIGQNTVQIIEDIGTEAGLDIVVLGLGATGDTQILRPNGDIIKQWAHTDSGGDGNHYKDVDEVVVDPDAGDGNNIYTSGDGLEDIFNMETHAMGENEVVKKIELYTRGKRDTSDNYCIASFYTPSTFWAESKTPIPSTPTPYRWIKVEWDNLALSQADLDALMIQYVYGEHYASGFHVHIDLFYVVITYGILDPFTKFIARRFRGTHCIDALNAVCELEGAVWYEDYENNRIVVLKPSVFESSGVVITEALRPGLEYEDICNQVRRIDVFGSTENVDYPIHEYSEDRTVSGFRCKQIINERIMTSGDAKEIADAQLARLNTKRPSIRVPLISTYPNLQMGRTINITFVRPTIAAANYPIRMIERSKFGKDGIKTVVYSGLGESPADEKIGMAIRKIGLIANRAMSDRLI